MPTNKPGLPSPLEAEMMTILMRQPSGAYGASLSRDYEESYGRPISAGAVYVVLERMEKKGFTTSTWREPTNERGGRRKRMYVITAAGRMALQPRPGPDYSGFQQGALVGSAV